MLAYRLIEWQQPPELVEVPVPDPGPGEVLIKVGGAGLCHSDLHLMEWPAGALPFDPPFTLGHENAGWVERLGEGATGFEPGEPVAVYGPWGCGHCRACRLSREDYCENQVEIGKSGGGLGHDGGMAEYMLVPSTRLLLPLGEGLDPRDAAPLSDAALTPYHAIRRSLHRLVPGSTAVVIGVGGLGQMAVQIIEALSAARIVAIDTDGEKLKAASGVGADHVLLSEEATPEAVRSLTGGRGAELVLDVVGAESTLALAAQLLSFEGDLTVLGLAGGTFEYSAMALPWGARLATTYWGTAVELIEVLDLARAGEIEVRTERVALDGVADAYDRLREGRVDGRAVACPNG
jgi:propanol-preferring alcohol dehydrogenase